VQLLETDLRALWPQVYDMIDQQLQGELQQKIPKAVPDFVRQRRELLQSIRLALSERASAKSVEDKLTQLLRETSMRLRVPAGVAAAGGVAALIAAMTSAAVADVTGILAASAAVVGTVMVFRQRRKILRAYEHEMETKRVELSKAIEQELNHAIDLFYNEALSSFQPLAAFCIAQRRMHEPRLLRAQEVQQKLANLAARF
jgi:hypothetical protein